MGSVGTLTLESLDFRMWQINVAVYKQNHLTVICYRPGLKRKNTKEWILKGKAKSKPFNYRTPRSAGFVLAVEHTRSDSSLSSTAGVQAGLYQSTSVAPWVSSMTTEPNCKAWSPRTCALVHICTSCTYAPHLQCSLMF